MQQVNNNNFGVIILSYKRSDNVKTFELLKRFNYTGKIYIMLSEEDPTISEYQKRYGDQIVTFRRNEYAGKFDICDNQKTNKGVVYARNAVFDVARSIGLQYFLLLDDDYVNFNFRFNEKNEYHYKQAKNLDLVFDNFLKYFKENKKIKTICFAQGGDFIGGAGNSYAKKIKLTRKAMNCFICSVNRPFEVIGRINEDVNTYVQHGVRGDLFFTSNLIAITQPTTQTNAGGLTEQYKDDGTYVKSFYTVMLSPSSVKVKDMGDVNRRLHHSIKWANTVPMIISDKHKKH